MGTTESSVLMKSLKIAHECPEHKVQAVCLFFETAGRPGR